MSSKPESNSNIDELFEKATQETVKELSLRSLEIPDVKVDNQRFVLIQFVENKDQILKIWGAFPDQKSADIQAEQIKGKIGNEMFDLYVLEMYGLASRPPTEVNVQRYNNPELQSLIDSKAEQKKKINERFDTRDQTLENESTEQESRMAELASLNSEPVVKKTIEPKPKPNSEPESKSVVKPNPVKAKRLDVPPTHFDPEDDLHKHEELECLNVARATVNQEFDDEMFCKLILAKEDIRVENQNWALVSFTGKGCKQVTEHDGIVFWGIFDKVDAKLQKHAKALQSTNLDIHVLELYTWIAIPPNPEYMKSIEAHETHLLKVLKRHKLNHQFQRERFQYRKNKLKNNPDMNQFRRAKNVFRELLKRFGHETATDSEETGLQNRELYEQVFPKSKPLPKFEVIDETKTESI